MRGCRSSRQGIEQIITLLFARHLLPVSVHSYSHAAVDGGIFFRISSDARCEHSRDVLCDCVAVGNYVPRYI